MALWRAKVEEGQTNSYYDETLTFVDIISPTALTAPDSDGQPNTYTCTLEIGDKLFSIDYLLPLSLAKIEAGQYRADILAEMDGILQSIIWEWELAGEPLFPTPTPLDHDATLTTTLTSPNLPDLTAAAMETVIAFNQTDGVRETGPFIEIPANLWATAIANLQPRRVYWHQNNLAVVLNETTITETGLYIGVPISSYALQNDDTIQFTPEGNGVFQFSKKRSD